MLMGNFMTSRRSIRDFRKKSLTKDSISALNQVIEEINGKVAPYGAEFKIVLDGKTLFQQLEGIGGYAGSMIDAPAYIALHVLKETDESYIYGSYFMEELVTQLGNLNLGSCWVTLTGAEETVKMNAIGYASGKVDHLLAIGYPQRRIPVGEEAYNSTLGIGDFVYMEDLGNPATIEELEQMGLDDLFYYVRFSPSSHNRQPWRFVIKSNQINLYIEDYQGVANLMDAGIMMYYFTKLSESLRLNIEWQVTCEDAGRYKFIASAGI